MEWVEREKDRRYHKLANIFPMMQDDEFEKLKADVLENGLIEPIVIYSDGSIIDGRNRHKACIETGVMPKFETWSNGKSLVKFVVSKNMHRRHLSSSQKAAIALDILPELEAEARERHEKLAGRPPANGGNNSTVSSEQGKARDQAAEMMDTNPRYVSDAKMIQQKAPEMFERVKTGEMSIPEAKKEIRSAEIKQYRAEMAKAGEIVPVNNKWNVYHADVKTWQATKQYDFIITDPPYPKEYLELYEVLAIRSNEWLKPGGLLIAMCGQSYLNQIYEMMSKHIRYYWTACYLTPGQPTPLRQVNVNTTWKPLLVFSKGQYTGKIFGDVFKSDGNDKDFHKWGQSISGMVDIVSKICLPGQSMLDPFCGAGTTGLAALQHGCFFDGLDVDIDNVNISKRRLNDATAEG